jgi:hypothetical protein
MKNFTFIKKTSSLGSKQLRFNWRQFLVLSLFIVTTVLTSFTLTAQNLPGIAPVQTPIGGFGVDGDAYANTPTPAYLNVGDWFYNATLYPGTGRGLFNPDGTITDPTRTFFLQDNWIQNTDLTIFTGTNKINHNPSTYTWGPGSSPNKNEIQNAAAHFTYGAPGLGGSATDLWCIFAGDRMVTNGSSYIDFEFLQKTLTMTGTTSGGFTSAGTSGGRTIGDILVTIEFVQGGGAATVVIRKWQAVGAGYEYVVYPNSDFVGKIFMTNNTSVTSVPFDAYGGNTYAVNQWAEGAINLTQVLGIGQDPCYSISTLFIRTRSSGSSDQSELKDFPGAPIQLDLGLIPDAPGVTTGTRCGPGAVSFTATGCTETGSVLKWYASATSVTPLHTGSTYNISITETTSLWVSCTNAAGCEGPRTQITRIVNTIVPGVIAGGGTLCSPFDPVAFTSTTPGSGGGTITYQWQISTTSAVAGFANIGGATMATYDAGVVTVPTWFRRVATSTLNDVPCADNSNVLLVSPNAIVPGMIAGGGTLCSPFDPVAFTSTTSGSGGGTISYQWQISTTSADAGFANIGGATLATYDAGVVSVPTWFRRVATSTLNDVPCADNSNVLMVTPNAIVPGVIAGSQTLCSPFDPVAFTSTTPGSGGGTISYQWQMSTTSADAGFANIGGATLATYDAGVVSVPTWFRRVATSTLNDVPCADNSNVLMVTPNAIVPGVIAGNQTICEGEDAAAFTSTTPGSGSGTIAYQWQSSSDGINFDNIVGATNATYDEGILNASMWYKRLATSTLNDVICEATSNIIKVTTEPCGGPLCTYTQGFYGNAGGMACTPDGTLGTLALIQRSIDNMGGTLYIGRGSNAGADGGSFTLPYAFAQKIIDIMPGGGAASVLMTDYDQNSLPPLKNGKISNGLLSQTIALALNLYMPPNDLSKSVGDFVLEGGKYLVTNKKAKTSMCSDPVAADCYDESDAIKSWWIPANVVNALPAPKNVWSLFQLAKDALGGVSTGVSLSDINKAVDAINNAFDGCRFFLRYSTVNETCPIFEPTVSAKVAAVVEEPVVIDSSIDFKVYPVPYEDVISVSYKFEYGTDVTIQVFNLQGGLMYGVVDNRYNNGEVAVKQISLPRTFDQALIIRLTTNKEKLSKTIVAKSSTQR